MVPLFPHVGVDPGVYCTWGFCNLTVNSGCALGPLEASALGGKLSSPYGKVRYIMWLNDIVATSFHLRTVLLG